MGKRILETTLPNNYMDGEVLYGSELNKIVGVLRSGVNVNKEDIDKLLLGEESDFVFTTKDVADAYLLENTPEIGQYALVMSGGEDGEKIDVYKFDGYLWELQVDEVFSIFNAYRVSKDFQGRLDGIDEALLDITNGVTAFKKVKYDVNSPAATLEIGETGWNDVAGTLETRLSTDVYLLHSQEALFKCQNISGKDIANGTAVYISGASGGSPNFYVDKADNTNLTKASRMIGLTTEEINDNSSGYVCFSGIVNGVNTASFNVGDMLYLSTGGTLTNVRPSGLVVEVGIVIRKHSNNGAVAINPRYYPRLDDLSNVNFTDSAEGDVAIRLANGTYANYNLTSKLGEIDAKDLEQDGRLDDVESDITNLETYSATKAELTTHNEDATAHLPIRQEIEVIRQDVSRIEGRVKSYGEINYTQSELMALNEGARNTAIYDDILARFEDYTLANGDAVYTKASATDNDHEWEYNGNTWVDNGAYILQKASNTLFGVVKGGNVYTNIINGLIEVILSDYATKVGDSTNSYTYQQLKTILDTYASDIADRYTKSEVYNKTEIDNMGFSTNDYTNEDKQNVEKIPTIEQYIVDLVNDKVSKTSIVDNLTTNDATKVLSAKQGKALQDTKEALANKAVDFSVVNDIKYPTTKAVKDLVDATVGDIDAILDNILGV